MSMAATKRTNRTPLILISILEDISNVFQKPEIKLDEIEDNYCGFYSKPEAREGTV